MAGASKTRALLGLLVAAAVGCGNETLPGDYFSVVVSTRTDGCNNPEVPYSGTFEYRLVETAGSVTIFIEEDVLANGTWDGCNLSYQSPVFTERRSGGGFIKWNIVGDAKAANAGSLCDGSADGWEGRETIQVVESTDPAVEGGCAYQMDASGTFLSSEGGAAAE